MATFAPDKNKKLNVMKKLLLLAAFGFAATFATAQNNECIELFISEYLEGWGNDKALEIYNPTSQPVNLSNYMLARYSNGSTSAQANQRYELPDVMLEPYDAWVIVLDKTNPDGEGQEQPVTAKLQEKADHFANPVYTENNTMYFNGNDVMVLSNISGSGNGFPVDIIGRIGENPGEPNFPVLGGWNDVVPGYTTNTNGVPGWTVNHAMVRKPEVTIGRFAGVEVFNTGAEWDSTAAPGAQSDDIEGVWESLGTHDCACNAVSSTVDKETAPGKLFPNPVGTSELLRFTAPYQTERYEIFDITGKRVADVVVGNIATFEIGTAKLGKGVYVIRTYAGNSAYVNKFVVQ
jgi:hypothetical protein